MKMKELRAILDESGVEHTSDMTKAVLEELVESLPSDEVLPFETETPDDLPLLEEKRKRSYRKKTSFVDETNANVVDCNRFNALVKMDLKNEKRKALVRWAKKIVAEEE